MSKRTINLIIHQESDNPSLRRLKKYLPFTAAVSIFLFISVFIAILIYINSNLAAFKLHQIEAEQIEGKILALADVEATYTLTADSLSKLSQILASATNYTNVVSEIVNLASNDIAITTANIDRDGNISISLTAANTSALDEFIRGLIDKEEIEHKFSKIEAHGIVRDQHAKYVLTIILQADKTLLQ